MDPSLPGPFGAAIDWTALPAAEWTCLPVPFIAHRAPPHHPPSLCLLVPILAHQAPPLTLRPSALLLLRLPSLTASHLTFVAHTSNPGAHALRSSPPPSFSPPLHPSPLQDSNAEHQILSKPIGVDLAHDRGLLRPAPRGRERHVRHRQAPPLPCVSTDFVAKTPPLPCLVFPLSPVAQALPLPCVSNAFVPKTPPFRVTLRQDTASGLLHSDPLVAETPPLHCGTQAARLARPGKEGQAWEAQEAEGPCCVSSHCLESAVPGPRGQLAQLRFFVFVLGLKCTAPWVESRV